MTGPSPSEACGPGPDGFGALAAKHRIVPVWRELVADTITPVAAFLQSLSARRRRAMETSS